MSVSGADVLVVIGFAEALSAPEVLWSLIDAGYKVIAFCRKGKRTTIHHSKYAKVYEITSPQKDIAESLADLGKLLNFARSKEFNRRVLLPLDDSSLWLCSHIEMPKDWILAGPQGECAELAINKQIQTETAVKAGLTVPQTVVIKQKSDFKNYVAAFPLIIRPSGAVTPKNNKLQKGENWICSGDSELERVKSLWNETCPLLIQPYLEGIGEGVFGLATDHGVIAWSGHRRLRMMNPHGSGSSACISQPVSTEIKPQLQAFLNSSGWRGLFMFELLRTIDDVQWFVEFNGRSWGSMALSRRQSLEYPAWTVQQAIDAQYIETTELDETKKTVCKNLGREVMHLLFVLRGPKSKAVYRWPKFWDSVCGVLNFSGSYFYNWRRDDWRVFVSDFWYTIRDQLFKRMSH